ncbi:MAG: DMT family transporter [Flavobacteriales bacterium]|jgi:drug/metabolite transporter (DMT)-like permease|nr:DMT family transporter [Flavobacteriales bacterium]
MALVIAAAFFMAVLFLLFKVFDRRQVPLLPAIVVNYLVAFGCGSLVAAPWRAGDLSALWMPAAVLGFLFITIFRLTGLSTRRAGVASTTVASKLSLVLTVLFAVVFYGDRPGVFGWTGIVLALAGVVLSSPRSNGTVSRTLLVLPLTLFLGNAAIDILINWTQRTHLTPDTEAVFPTLAFAFAGVLGLLWTSATKDRDGFGRPATWVGGAVLGAVNYIALYYLVKALANSGLAPSAVYPLVNIGVILFGTGLSMLLFRERPVRLQQTGIACAVVALVLIILGTR